MGNNRSRIAPVRSLRIIDSQTRTRFQNQRELIQFRRKINNINIKHSDEMSRLNFIRYDAKKQLQQIQHDISKKQLSKKMDALNQQTSSLSINKSELFDESNGSLLESSSLLLHNLNASNEWEKSIIMPFNQFDIPNQRKSSKTFETIRPLYSSKFETSQNSFGRTESFVLNDNLSLKQHTEQMKKAIQIAIARSKRDSKIITRRNAHKY